MASPLPKMKAPALRKKRKSARRVAEPVSDHVKPATTDRVKTGH
jgi:hypothetical protein